MVSNLGQMPYESEFGKLKLGANSPAGTRQRTERRNCNHKSKLTIAKSHILSTAKEGQFSSLCSDNVIVEQVANLHGRNITGSPITCYSTTRSADWCLVLTSGDFWKRSLANEICLYS